MHEERSLKEIGKMQPLDRWKLACEKLSNSSSEGVVQELIGHLRAHENTRWLVYESHLSDQIPRSYAAHAFRELRKSVLHHEILRLCTFWDPVDLDNRSIPTIVALADCSGVTKCVHDQHFRNYQGVDEEKAKQWGKKKRDRLRRGIRDAKKIEKSEILLNARNFRDKLAHQLEQTRREKSDVVPAPRYGDERKLLGKTVTSVKRLYDTLSATDFAWEDTKKMHRRNAEALWKGVTIEVLR